MDCDNGFGKASVDMIVCRKCIHGKMEYAVPIQPATSEYSSWCTKAKCPSCGHVWYVCRECTRIRVQLDTKKKLQTHNWRYHKKGRSFAGENGHPVAKGDVPPTLHEKQVREKKKKRRKKDNESSCSSKDSSSQSDVNKKRRRRKKKGGLTQYPKYKNCNTL